MPSAPTPAEPMPALLAPRSVRRSSPVVGEGRAAVPVRCGCDANDVVVQSSGINRCAGAFIPSGCHKNDASFIGVRDGLGERRRIGSEIEAHVHDVGMMLNGVVEGCNDVGKIAGAVGRKGLERKNLGLGSDKMYKAGGHRAVAECGVVRGIEDRSDGLGENRCRVLLHVACLLILGVGVSKPVLGSTDIQPFEGSGLVARKVVAGKQNRLEDGVIDVHTGINNGDDAGATDAETVLRVLKTDYLGGRLSGVGMPNNRSVVIHWGSIVEA